MQLTQIKEYTGSILLLSGLHIGAGDTEMRIGGIDNQVIRHPYTNEPYIPGSSLKGKIRSLLELKSGLMPVTDGAPLSLRALKNAPKNQAELGKKIVTLFGSSGADEDEKREVGPTRVFFADCFLDEAWKKEAEAFGWSYVELKTENAINRIKGTAENPRTTERVPAGARFRFSISLRVFDIDQQDGLENLLFQGIKLLELDSLGGSGSRGYGKVKFVFDDENVRSVYERTKVFDD